MDVFTAASLRGDQRMDADRLIEFLCSDRGPIGVKPGIVNLVWRTNLLLIAAKAMARQWIIEFAGAIYHMMSGGNGGRIIFRSNAVYLDLLEPLAERFNIEVHGYG